MSKANAKAKIKKLQPVITYDPVIELAAPADEAKIIKSLFTPMFDKMDELEVEFNEFFKSLNGKAPTAAQCDEAHLLIKKYVKTRTGTDAIHKSAKAHHLLMGRVADGFKNAQKAAAGDKESKLLEVAKHFELLEAKRKKELTEERTNQLLQYGNTGEHMDLGEMSEEVWLNVFAGVKVQFEIKAEAEAKAKVEAEKNEKLQALYNSRRLELSQFAPFVEYDDLTLETTEAAYKKLFKASGDKWRAEKKRAELAEKQLAKEQKEREQAEAKRKKEQEKAEAQAEKIKELVRLRINELTGVFWDGEKATYKGNTIVIYTAISTMTNAAFAKLKNNYLAVYNADVKAEAEAAANAERLQAEANQRAEQEQAEQARLTALENARGKEKLSLWAANFPTSLPELDIKSLNVDCQDLYSDIVAKYAGFMKWAKAEVKKIESE